MGESEYYALVKTAALALGVRSLFEDLGIVMGVETRSDSTAAKSLSSRLGVGRTKHMQSRWLWLQEKVQDEELTVQKEATAKNVSDILTKPCGRPTLDKHLEQLGVIFKKVQAE